MTIPDGKLPKLLLLLAFAAIAAAPGGSLRAGEIRSFRLGSQIIEAEEVTIEAPVLFRSMRFNEATEQWNVDLVVTNRGDRPFAPTLFLLIDGFSNTPGPLAPDGVTADAPVQSFIRVDSNGPLVPGQASRPRTIALGYVEGAGAPRLQLRVFGVPTGPDYALGLTRSLNEAGQPLTGVRVTERGPQGERVLATDPDYGVVTLGRTAGEHVWKFERDGHLPVWRQQTLVRGAVRLVPNPRLARRNPVPVQVAAGGNAVVQDPAGDVRLEFVFQQPGQSATVALTPVDGQTLPGPLPQGWSPLRAFWIESTNLALAAGVSMRPAGPVAQTDALALAKWNPEAAQWEVQTGLSGNGTNVVEDALFDWGAYALVVADSGSLAPPFPEPGEPLPPFAPVGQTFPAFTAGGTVNPSSSPASRIAEEVTALASVLITNTVGGLSSGLILRAEVTEDYRLQDASKRFMSVYDTFITAYRRPANTGPNALVATFPMRPVLLFGGDELTEATVRLEVLSPDIFRGTVFEQSGGLLTADRIRVSAAAGDFSTPQAAILRPLAPGHFSTLLTPGQTLAASFDLTVSSVAPGRKLGLQISGLAPNRDFILSRILSGAGFNGLEPVERLRSDANGVLTSLEPSTGERLPGMRGAGQYLLVQVGAPHGLITGVTRNAQGQPAPGLPVRVTGQPWLTFSSSNGAYRLVSPAGAAQVTAANPATGDTAFADTSAADPARPVALDLGISPSGPRVISLTPADGAANVSRVTPVEIVFSEPVNPGTLVPDGIQLMGTNAEPIAASLTLNPGNTRATLLPTEQLAPDAVHVIRLSTNIADLTGLKLEGPFEFVFITASDLLNRASARLIIYEPGATNIPPQVRANIPAFTPGEARNAVVVHGTAGAAEPERPVILINESTGETSTVLSRPDGSFYGLIRGDEEDFISASIQNSNGTATYLPVSRQEFDNGFVGLYPQGGILEAESDGGPVQVFVEPQAVQTRSTFRIESLGLPEILAAVNNTQPADARLLGGFKVEVGGDPLAEQAGSSVSIPFDPASLNLPPGESAEEGAFALALPRVIDDQTVYQVVDKLRYRDGKIESNTLPFLGLLAILGGEAVTQAGGFALTYLFVGNQQIVISGKTLQLIPVANPLNPTLASTALPKPLPGAFVSARPSGRSSGRPGRLDPGTLFSTAGSDGVYALVVARRTFEFASDFTRYVITASHPAFEDTPANVLDTTFGDAAQEYDFTFTRRINVDGPAGKPRIISSVEPRHPGLNQPARLKVTAQHLRVAPEVFVSVQSVASLLPGVEVRNEDVQQVDVDNTEIGRKRVRRVDFTSSKALEARIRIAALATAGSSAQSAETFEYIRFGAGTPVLTNDLVAADAGDQTGPAVIGTYPPANGILGPSDRIAITFNEPIDRSLLADSTAVALQFSNGGLPGLALSEDQKTLFVSPGLLLPGPTHTLILSTAVKDLSGNPLNRTAAEPAGSGFSLPFRVAPVLRREMPGMELGGGAVVHNGHVYALERAGAVGGELVVYRLDSLISTTPGLSPVTARLNISAGFPRDLVLIPKYSFKRKPGAPVETRDLLAVVGGSVGVGGEDENSVQPIGQVLRVFDISNPAQPERLIGARLTLRPSVVSAVRWTPPHLTYLEIGSDLQQVGVLDLQEMIVGFLASNSEAAAFPLFGVRGKDNNGDGDYVDPGDQFPLPEREPAEFFGKRMGLTVEGTTQTIQDFDYLPPFQMCAVILNQGRRRNPLGQPVGPELPPSLRVLLSEQEFVVDPAGILNFSPGSRPKRIFLIPGQQVLFNGALEEFHLALVSLAPDADGQGKLAVCDVTFPHNPALLGAVPLPDTLGLPQSVTRRTDGLLALATGEHLVLLDPLRLLTPPAITNRLHPSIVSIIPHAGSGNRSLAQTPHGVGAVNLGGRNEVIVTAPNLRFVHFPGSSGVVQPQQLVDNPQALETESGFMREAGEIQLARVRTEGGAVSSLAPAAPVAHYHVLMEAPGELGREILLAIESLNESGKPLPNPGPLFPPVRAMSEFALNGLSQKPRTDYDAPVGSLKAFRLSSDPKSRFYNTYLSRPFALISERIKAADLQNLKQTVDREILWSGALLRATIDPQDASNPVVGDFASTFDSSSPQLRPGVAALAITLPGHYLFGRNPPPVGGELPVPATFGTVNAANGEFRHDTVDFELPSPRMPIEFSRSYGSQDLFDGPFGRGWDFKYNQRLTEYRPENFPEGSRKPLVIRATESASSVVEAGDVVFTTGEARIILFKKLTNAPPGQLTNDPLLQALKWFDSSNAGAVYYLPGPNEKGVFDVLCRFPGGEFCRVTPEGVQYWYAAGGRLERIYDKYPKNKHVLRYNPRGELVRIVDESVAADRFLDLGYYRHRDDPLFDSAADLEAPGPRVAGRIARLKDYTGAEEREVTFEYHETGTLERRLGIRASGANGGFAQRPVTTYQWDSNRTHLRGVVAGNEANTTGGAGAGTALFTTTTQVNTEDQPVATGGTGAGGPVQLNLPTSPQQNSAANVGQIRSGGTGPDGAQTDFEFDPMGYPKSIQMTGSGGPPARFESTYDELGRLRSIRYPEGNTVTYNYFPSPPTFRSRPNIQSIVVDPGPRGGGALTSTFNGGYDLTCNLPTGQFTDFNGKTITYALTPDKRDVDTITYGSAGVHDFDYNENGQVALEKTPEGVTLDSRYEPDTGFLVESRRGSQVTRYTYGSGGGGFEKAGELGVPTRIALPRAAAATIDLDYDARLQNTRIQRGSRQELRGYDENGNVSSVNRTLDSGQNYEETRLYDQISFLRQVTVKGVEVDGQARDLVTEFTPDAAFRVKEIRYPDNKIRSFQYNHLGHVTRMSLGSTADADDYHETYGRDLHGNLTSVSTRGELTRTMAYDGHDRMFETRNKVGPGGDDEVTTLTYFGGGQRKLAKVASGSEVVWEREVMDVDELGRPKTEELRGGQVSGSRAYTYAPRAGGGLLTTVAGPRDTVRISTDGAGRVVIEENGLAAATHRLDDNDNLERIESLESGVTYLRNFTYDALDHLVTESDPESAGGFHFRYTPRLDGRIRETRDGRSSLSTSDFTVLGELKTLTRPLGIQFNHQFDAQRLPRKVLDAAGRGNETTYDAQLRTTGMIYRSGDAVSLSNFDRRNQPQALSLPGGGSIDRSGGYDLQGRLVRQTTRFAGRDFNVQDTVHDALGRVRSVKFGSSAQHAATFSYDKLGPLIGATYNYQPGGSFTITAQINSDGSRRQIGYPSGTAVTETRANSGRLNTVTAGGVALWSTPETGYKGADLPGATTLGGVVRELNDYDQRKRLIRRRYETPAGARLAEMRFKYDAADNLLARQFLHRNGRADVFAYDTANRLSRGELGARPALAGAVRNNLAGLSGGEGFAAGLFARSYSYDGGGLDLLLGGGNPANPSLLPEQGLPGAPATGPVVPAFARALGSHDAYLHAASLDGVARGGTDALGNVQSTTLLVRRAGDTDPRKARATQILYNALNQLVRIEFEDGRTLDYEYLPDGLMHHRVVRQGGVTLSDRVFIWDQGRLIEEYEVGSASNQLVGRYYYANGDWPVAADLPDSGGQLRPHYFFCDNVYSVIAIAGESGQVLERISYDPWGQPMIQKRDTAAPRVAQVTAESGGRLLFRFSESVFPEVTGAGTTLVTDAGPLPNPFTLTAGGQAVNGQVELVEDAPNAPFSSVIRFSPSGPLNGAITVQVRAGVLFDDWGNGNLAETLNFAVTGPPGVLFSGAVADTGPERAARSALGNPFLFHGQYFDYEAGLVYLRARFYDPFTGQFLQRDPMQYEDSVNLYAGFGGNPLSNRDPSGLTIVSGGRKAIALVTTGRGGMRAAAAATEEVTEALVRNPFRRRSVIDLGREASLAEVRQGLHRSIDAARGSAALAREGLQSTPFMTQHRDAAKLFAQAPRLLGQTAQEFEAVARKGILRVFPEAQLARPTLGGVHKEAGGISWVALNRSATAHKRELVLIHEIQHANLAVRTGITGGDAFGYLVHELMAYRREIAFDLMRNVRTPGNVGEYTQRFLKHGNASILSHLTANPHYRDALGITRSLVAREGSEALRLVEALETGL